MMNRAIIPLLVTVFLSTLSSAQTLIYSWRNGAGMVHIVDDLDKVPLHYREGMKIYRIPSAKEVKGPRSGAPSIPVTKVEEVEEATLEGKRLEEGTTGVGTSITDLRERLEKLRRDRETKRIRVIRKRARGETVVREKGELEEIDREIEMLTNQLEERMEAFRSLEQEKSPRGGP